ncbi:MAG: hypothetical protein JSS32_07330 [Verrucomicrobia bacterium]|nr:hypothetical protein [Verrucomicrobiota bacterium]
MSFPAHNQVIMSLNIIKDYQCRVELIKIDGRLIHINRSVREIIEATNESIEEFCEVLDSFQHSSNSKFRFSLDVYNKVQGNVIKSIADANYSISLVIEQVKNELAWQKALSAIRNMGR